MEIEESRAGAGADGGFHDFRIPKVPTEQVVFETLLPADTLSISILEAQGE